MKKPFILYFVSFIFWGGFSVSSLAQLDLKQTFEAANQAYADGRYEDAQEGFESILVDHIHFESEFNLGNVFYKQGKLAQSILHYERARKHEPNHSDLRSNLTLANARVMDRIESLPTKGITDIWERIVAPGRHRIWFRFMLFFWTIGFISLALRIWQSKIGNRRILGTVGTTFVGMGLLCALLEQSSASRIECSQEAVVMVNQASVRNEPGSASALTLFVLHEGTKVRLLQQAGDHWEVALLNGNVGWLPASDLEEI
jgi:tetratricopeptide (TPR) repeat protein